MFQRPLVFFCCDRVPNFAAISFSSNATTISRNSKNLPRKKMNKAAAQISKEIDCSSSVVCPPLAPRYQLFLLRPLTVLTRQTRQAVRVINKSIFLTLCDTIVIVVQLSVILVDVVVPDCGGIRTLEMGEAKARGRKPKSCFQRVFNFKLGCLC